MVWVIWHRDVWEDIACIVHWMVEQESHTPRFETQETTCKQVREVSPSKWQGAAWSPRTKNHELTILRMDIDLELGGVKHEHVQAHICASISSIVQVCVKTHVNGNSRACCLQFVSSLFPKKLSTYLRWNHLHLVLFCIGQRWPNKINGNFRILKWRYCTIFLAIFCGYIPLHYIGLKNRPYIVLYMVATSNQSVPESWPLIKDLSSGSSGWSNHDRLHDIPSTGLNFEPSNFNLSFCAFEMWIEGKKHWETRMGGLCVSGHIWI